MLNTLLVEHVAPQVLVDGMRILALRAEVGELLNIGDLAAHRRCGGHGGGHQVSPPPVPLFSLKVAIGRAGAQLLQLELVGVYGVAHGTHRLAPVVPC